MYYLCNNKLIPFIDKSYINYEVILNLVSYAGFPNFSLLILVQNLNLPKQNLAWITVTV